MPSLRPVFLRAFLASLILPLCFANTTIVQAKIAKVAESKTATTKPVETTTTNASANPFRLSKKTIPSHYALTLEPDLEKFTYTGDVAIYLKQNVASNTIVLNSLRLKISKAVLNRVPQNKSGSIAENPSIEDPSSKEQIRPVSIDIDKPHEKLSLKFAKELAPGDYVLHLNYSGVIGTQLDGFYRSAYKGKDGKEQWIFSTDLEPTYARSVFPCFDEPDLKATIALTVKIPNEYTAISNSPLKSSTSQNASQSASTKSVSFDTTPKMSTYIFALIIGKLEAEPELSYEGIPVRVYTIPGMSDQGHYAQAMAIKLLAYYHKYFGINYPGKKLDLIALPNYGHGAMENLGAVTFRASNLLVDKDNSDLATKQRVAEVVAHELAHMWFGDLVTMKWWDDIWLNESFATWMATKAISDIEPSWDIWGDFALGRTKAMFSDSLLSTRPVHSNVQSPVEAMALFDEIAYGKGASLMQMLESYLGADVFRAGMRHYMKAHAYGNATRDDLWQSLSTASGTDVKSLMHNWIESPGYPIVAGISNDKKNNNNLQLEQKRFLLQSAVNRMQTTKQEAQRTATRETAIWQIPMCYKTLGHNGIDTLLLNTKNKQLNKPNKGLTLLNANANGYYRVNYSHAQIEKLLPSLKKLSAPERLCLLSDRFNLALAGGISVTEYLNFLKNYRGESDPNVAWIMIESLRFLERIVEPENKSAFRKFVCNMLLPTKEVYGWTAKPSELPNITLLRVEIMRALGTFGQDTATIKEARQYFDKYSQDAKAVDPEILEAVASIVAYNGDAKTYAQIKEQYKAAKTPFDEERSMRALCAFHNKQLLEKTLVMCEKSEFRSQDAPSVIASLVRNEVSAGFAWPYVRDNWALLNKRYAGHMLGRIIGNMAYNFKPAQAKDIRAFLTSHDLGENARTGKKAIELLSIYQAFASKNSAALNKWLRENYSK